MNIRTKFGVLCTALTLAASNAQAAITKVLYVASLDTATPPVSNSAGYASFITTRYPGATFTQKATGTTGDDLIGGDLDRVANFDGVSQTVKAYLQSYDLIIVGIPTNSANFIDIQPQTVPATQVNQGDWASINKPVLFQSAVVVRQLEGRTGMFSGTNNSTPAFSTTTVADSVRVSTSALSTSILAGTTDPTNLYKAVSTDTIVNAATCGGGERIINLTTATVNNNYGVVFWAAGATNANGQTLAAKRAFMPLKASPASAADPANLFPDLTADGVIVLGNLIDQLVSTNVVQVPPSGLVATPGISQVSLSWTAASNTVSYNVKRSTTAGGPYTTISTAGAVTGTTFVDSTVTNETYYYYIVTAVDAASSESGATAEVSALPYASIEPSKKILYVGGTVDNTAYHTFMTTGRYANNVWTFKPSGTGDDQIGGALDRAANFDGAPTTPKAYMETFDLIIVSVPNTSGNFANTNDPFGAQWAGLTKPVLINACTIARQSTGGSPRTAFFTGDNFSTITFTTPTADSTRISTTTLSNALFSGVSAPTDLYSLTQVDTVLNIATYGNGDLITSNAGTQTVNAVTTNVTGNGIVFWSAGSTSPFNKPITANRAFYPFKNGIDDLSGSGKQVLINLVKQLGLTQTVLPAVVNTPTTLVATAGEGKVDLTWNPAASASYIVKRSTVAGGPYTTISSGALIATSYTDSTVVGGTTYFYVVSSFNAAATPSESANSNESTATPTAAPLTAPSALIATAGVNKVDLSWNPGTGAVSFNIKRATTTGGPYTTISTGAVTGTTYTDNSAVGGTTYFYVVSGVDATPTESADSNEASATAIALTAIESWRVAKFGSSSNTGNGADAADPDVDGRSNLLEYATGTEPLTADAGSPAVLGSSAGKLTLTFTRIADPALTYVVRGSSDLTAAWTETPVLSTTGAGNVAGSVTAQDSVLVSAQPRRFLRLEISR